MQAPRATVDKFIAAVLAHDLEGIGALLTDDTKLVNKDGTTTEGKAEVLAVWKALFERAPQNKATFSSVNENGKVFAIAGHVDGPHGTTLPMLWQAQVEGDLIYVWQVFVSTPDRLAVFGLGGDLDVK